eukprot:9740580-Alexandrium_andersonii.AAC.1
MLRPSSRSSCTSEQLWALHTAEHSQAHPSASKHYRPAPTAEQQTHNSAAGCLQQFRAVSS